jgi:hypothetical protein
LRPRFSARLRFQQEQQELPLLLQPLWQPQLPPLPQKQNSSTRMMISQMQEQLSSKHIDVTSLLCLIL